MKRVILIGFGIPIMVVVEIINWTCLALDHVFFPGFCRVVIKPPHFIIGMPRSATTFCYSLLVADSENTSAMKLWEILLAPSVIQKKLILSIKKTDQKLHHVLYKLISYFDRYFFRNMEAFHRVSLFNFEEDDFLFLHVFSTLSCSFLFPTNKRILSFRQFDENLKERQKRFLMNYYQGCIKRHLYVFGAEKRYLAKSPSHTPKIKTLLQYFPGCRFIYMLRDPLDTNASTITLFKQFKKIFHSSFETNLITDQVLILADVWYKYPLLTCKSFLGESVFVVFFRDLISKPFNVVRNLYTRLGLELSPQFEKVLLQYEQSAANYKTSNHYSPGEFGLTKEAMHDRYSFVYKDYIGT